MTPSRLIFTCCLLLPGIACWSPDLTTPPERSAHISPESIQASAAKSYVGAEAIRRAIAAVRTELSDTLALRIASQAQGQSLRERRAHLQNLSARLEQRLLQPRMSEGGSIALCESWWGPSEEIEDAFTTTGMVIGAYDGEEGGFIATVSIGALTTTNSRTRISNTTSWEIGNAADLPSLEPPYPPVQPNLETTFSGTTCGYELWTDSGLLLVLLPDSELPIKYYLLANSVHTITRRYYSPQSTTSYDISFANAG